MASWWCGFSGVWCLCLLCAPSGLRRAKWELYLTVLRANPEDVFTHAPILYEVFHIEAPLVFVGLMTFILILSSVAMVLSWAGHRKSRRKWKSSIWTIVVEPPLRMSSIRVVPLWLELWWRNHDFCGEIREIKAPAEELALVELQADHGESTTITVVVARWVASHVWRWCHRTRPWSLRSSKKDIYPSGTYTLSVEEAEELELPNLESNLAVKAYKVYSSEGDLLAVRLTNGFESVTLPVVRCC